MIKSSKIILDRDKLNRALKASNLTATNVSRMLGFSSDYIGNLFSPSHGGQIPIPNAYAICKILDVGIKDIEKTIDEVTSEQSLNEPSTLTQLEKINDTLKCINDTLKTLLDVFREAWIDKE